MSIIPSGTVQKNGWYIPVALLLSWMLLPPVWGQQGTGERWQYSNRDTAQLMQQVRKGMDLSSITADSALPMLQQALATSSAHGYKDGMAMSMFGLGLVYSETNRNDTALKWYSKALRLLEQAPNYKHMVPATFSNIGYIYYFKGNYSGAVLYLDSAARLLNDAKLPEERRYLAITLNTIAAIHMRMERKQVSLQYLSRAETICREEGFVNELAMILGNEGELYNELGQYTRAENLYREALRVFREEHNIESTALQATIKSGFANLRLKQGKPEDAVRLLKEVESQNKAYRSENTAIIPDYTMGRAYLQLKQYDAAELYLLKALKKSEELQVKDNLNGLHLALSQLYDTTGRYKAALQHLKAYQHLNDSLLNNEKAKDIHEIDAKYRTAEKNRELAAKQLQLSRQEFKLHRMQFWIAGVSATGLLLVLFFWGRNRISGQKRKVQENHIRILQQEQELTKQQQQISSLKNIVQGEEKERVRIARELHDGIVSQLMGVKLHFNAALQHAGEQLSNRKDFEHTLRYLEEATRDLRKTAHNFMPEAVLQGGLVQALSVYCETMEAASGIHIYFQHFGLPVSRDADRELSIYRIIQELVQNAIKHARCTQVIIEFNVEADVLAIDVEDNGAGMPEFAVEGHKGMGLDSVYTRVQALGGHIEISSEQDKGVNISMEFPL